MKKIFSILILLIATSAVGQIRLDLCTQWRDFTKATEVTALAQEGKYIWVGTKGGLIKFDTVTHVHELFLKTNSGIPVNWITCLLKDQNGALWIGTYQGGLARLDNGVWNKYDTHNQAFPDSTILSLSIDSSSNVWIGTYHGIVEYSQGQFIVNPSPLLPNQSVHAIATDPVGNVWASLIDNSTYNPSLAKFDGTKWTTFTPQNSSLSNDNIYSIACAKDQIWLGFQYGNIQSFDGTIFTNYTTQLSGTTIASLTIDGNGFVKACGAYGLIQFSQNSWQLIYGGATNAFVIPQSTWIGSNAGLLKLHDGTWDVFKDFSNSNLPTNEMEAALIVDQKNRMWCATFAGSYAESDKIPIFDGKKFSTITAPVSPKAQTRPISLCSDSNGNIWVGMIDTGIFKFDGNNWTIFSQSNSPLLSNRPKCMAYDKKMNKLWAGFYLNGGAFGGSAGCAVFDGTTWKAYTGTDMGYAGYAEINEIAVDAAGNVWAGAAYQGLSRFDGNNWKLFTTSNSGLPDNFITGVACQRSGAVWISTAGGIARYDKGIWTAYTTANSPLPWKDVSAVAVDSADGVWLGTFGHGAVRIDNGKWTIFGQENSGLTNYHIQRIVPDQNGNVWFAMEFAGIAEFNPHGFQDSIIPLFAIDTVNNCESAGIDSMFVFGNGCQGRKIIAQKIQGKDSDYYHILHQAVNPIFQDSIIVQFFPDTERQYNAYITIVLEDSTTFSIPLSGYGKGTTLIKLASAGVYNDTIGGEIQIPITLTHNSLISSAEMVMHYDTSMLVYQGCFLYSGVRLDHEEKWTGTSKFTFDSKDFGTSDTIAFVRFNIYPVKDPCVDVTFDSLVIESVKSNCSVLSNNSLTVHICTSITCGSDILSNFLRYSKFPEIFVTPNPSSNQVSIVSNERLMSAVIELYDILGQKIFVNQLDIRASIPYEIDLQTIKAGTFFLRISSNGSIRTHRLIIVK
jgi:ligand-binding sensor domain-containing protein